MNIQIIDRLLSIPGNQEESTIKLKRVEGFSQVHLRTVGENGLNTIDIYAGCPKIKASIRKFDSEQLITLLHSFLTSLDSVDLLVFFDTSFIRFGSLKVKLQSFSGDVICFEGLQIEYKLCH